MRIDIEYLPLEDMEIDAVYHHYIEFHDSYIKAVLNCDTRDKNDDTGIFEEIYCEQEEYILRAHAVSYLMFLSPKNNQWSVAIFLSNGGQPTWRFENTDKAKAKAHMLLNAIHNWINGIKISE